MKDQGELPITHQRAAQLIATAWLVTGQSFFFPPPHLSVFEGAPDLPWRLILAALSTLSSVAIIFSRFPRVASAALAGVIALELFATRTWFSHNRLFVLALLVTIALSTKTLSSLPRMQVGVVFLGSALDKLFAPAWRDGSFVTSFLDQLARFGLMWSPAGHVGEGGNLLAAGARLVVGDGTIAGWVVIGFELAVALAFFAGRRMGSWLNLAFHLGVFALTGSTMGLFFFAGVASSLFLLDEQDVPKELPSVALTALIASPLTHRFLPVLVLVGVLAWRCRARDGSNARAIGAPRSDG